MWPYLQKICCQILCFFLANCFAGTQEMATTNWVRSVESLQLYGGLVTLQATRAQPCTALTA